MPAGSHLTTGHRILDQQQWNRQIKAAHLQVLDGCAATGRLARDFLMHLGAKLPTGYRDPRAGQYRVHYVDTGFKVDARARATSGRRYLIDVRVEQDRAADKARCPDQYALVANAEVPLAPGQVAILGSARGACSSRAMRKLYPGAGFSAQDRVMLVISVQNP